MTPVRNAVQLRQSHSRVTDEAPTAAELDELVSLMSSVPDHSRLRPWRIIAMRGDARDMIAEGLAAAEAHAKSEPTVSDKLLEKFRKKAHRAPLVLAIIVSEQPSHKVPLWEQEAVASGVAHTLSLLLLEAGWGTMWRTGLAARSPEVHAAHNLAENEQLMGWIYVGGIPEGVTAKPRKPLELSAHLTHLGD